MLDTLVVQLVKVRGPFLFVRFIGPEHMADNHEHAVANGNRGTFASPALGEPTTLLAK